MAIETENIVKTTLNSMQQCITPMKTEKEEIKSAIKTLKTRKARDRSDWQNELVMFGGEEMIKSLEKILNMVSKKQQIPKKWETMRIKSIFKDARIKQVDKTRGLFITNIISKIQEKIIKERNSSAWELSTSPFQCGGKKGTSTIDHTLTILELINHNRYLNKETFLLFIDMEKCFDKLWLESGISELWRSGMNSHDANIIYLMNKNAKIVVETPVGETKEFNVRNTVKQGTIYGPLICSKEMELVNKINEKAVTIYSPTLEIESLIYVDDISNGGGIKNAQKQQWKMSKF